MLPEIKAMSPSHPSCQGHTHHRFTGLSAQVMHGSYSQSVWGSIYNKVCEAATDSSQSRPQDPSPPQHSHRLLLFTEHIMKRVRFLHLWKCKWCVKGGGMCDIWNIIHFAKSKARDLKMNCLLSSATRSGNTVNHDAQGILAGKKWREVTVGERIWAWRLLSIEPSVQFVLSGSNDTLHTSREMESNEQKDDCSWTSRTQV